MAATIYFVYVSVIVVSDSYSHIHFFCIQLVSELARCSMISAESASIESFQSIKGQSDTNVGLSESLRNCFTILARIYLRSDDKFILEHRRKSRICVSICAAFNQNATIVSTNWEKNYPKDRTKKRQAKSIMMIIIIIIQRNKSSVIHSAIHSLTHSCVLKCPFVPFEKRKLKYASR